MGRVHIFMCYSVNDYVKSAWWADLLKGKLVNSLDAQASAVPTALWRCSLIWRLPSPGGSLPAPVLIFWNVVTNKSQSSFVYTCLVPEEQVGHFSWRNRFQCIMSLALGISEGWIREGRKCFSRIPVWHHLFQLRAFMQKEVLSLSLDAGSCKWNEPGCWCGKMSA